MIIVLKKGATDEQVEQITNKIKEWGLAVHLSRGIERTIIGIIGDEGPVRAKPLEVFPGVESVMPVLKPYKRASRDFHPDPSVVTAPAPNEKGRPAVFGASAVTVIAGPCSVENRASLMKIAGAVKAAGARALRGGAFKPRTSPYKFQGLREAGLELLAEAKAEFGLPVVTEVMDPRLVERVAATADVLQVGARNMQNFDLLRAVGQAGKPVLLKRGMSSTLEELLMSAEYVLNEGNPDVILCERGIRTFETFTRNTVDISAVPVLKRETHLPVIVDPSHGTGHCDLVAPVARAAVAAGADGVMVEVHPDPASALCDGPQALLPETFEVLMREIDGVAKAIGRSA
ncbi:MAG: 3-deoxy-7-phosphoheptulonate synthase [Kiritimatiellae bacterium]|nr:3-deoxy-7-phosphoheptulonate synthase [Kiritimatiellia bacterium]